MDTTLNSDPTLLLYSYSTISNANFQEILLKSTTSNVTGLNELIELLSNNQDVFLYIRQLTQLMNQLHYFQLQKDQWTYYNDLGMTQGIWHGRVSKKMAAVNSMCYTYGRSKVLIKQRKQKYEQHFQHIQNELDEFMKKAPSQLHVDNNTIINIINNLIIYKDQYQLRVELERRRLMLHFDAKEHQLVNDFYKSKPRKSEVSLPVITQSHIYFCFDSDPFSKNYLEKYQSGTNDSRRNCSITTMDVNANYYRSTTLYVSGSTINTSQSDINTSTISNKSIIQQ